VLEVDGKRCQSFLKTTIRAEVSFRSSDVLFAAVSAVTGLTGLLGDWGLVGVQSGEATQCRQYRTGPCHVAVQLTSLHKVNITYTTHIHSV